MGIWPFQPSRERQDAARLLAAVQAAGRTPALYGEGRVPDTLDGRFEALCAYAAMALIRLGRDPAARPLAQRFTDVLFRHIDSGLREAGVGDLTVPKKMRGLAASFYGRLDAYAKALAAGDQTQLAEALGRNMGVAAPFAAALAGDLAELGRRQAGAPVAALFEPQAWGAP